MRIMESGKLSALGVAVLTLVLAGETLAQAGNSQGAQSSGPDRTAAGTATMTDATDGAGTPRIGVNAGDTLPLSLSDAIRRAMESNNEIDVAKSDVKLAVQGLRSILGGYDPVVSFTPRYTNNVQPQPSTLGGADLSGVTRSKEFRFDSSVRQAIRPTGGDLTVNFNNNRQETSSRFSQLNPTFSSTLGFTYNQPLLKNLEIDAGRRQVKIQRRRIDQSDVEFKRTATEVVNRVQKAYWDLVFALRDQQNKSANLNLAKENLRQIEARIAAGAAAPLQKAEIETELANRESDVLLAAQQVTAAENVLKQLILRDPSASEWGQQIIPTDRPAFSDEKFSLDSSLKEATVNRFELQRLKIQKEISGVDVKYFRNQLRPQVDFSTSYTLIGLSGTQVGASGTVPNRFIGGYGQAFDNLKSADTRSISFGLTFSLPILNRSAKADLATAQIQESQVDAQLRSQEQAVIAEVRNAVQAAETARQRVAAARRGRESAEIQLDGERKLFEVGRSTQFLLFQRENALTNARNAEIRAETDYNKALADLQRVTSTTLEKNNIVIADPKNEK